jgi:hypothetical protein
MTQPTTAPATTPNKAELTAGLTDEQIQELKNKHGELTLLTHPEFSDAAMIVRRPTKADSDRFDSEILSDRATVKAKAMSVFLKNCVVHPNRDATEKIIDRYPGIVSTYAEKLFDMIAADRRVETKKL